MDLRTPLEKNPPLAGNCGWGNHKDSGYVKMYREQRQVEISEDRGCYQQLNRLIAAKNERMTEEQSAMERLLEADMKELGFDGGFDLDVIARRIFKKEVRADQDGVGTCVGSGGGVAVGIRSGYEVLVRGDSETPLGMDVDDYTTNKNLVVPCIDYHYGCGKMRSYWDEDDQRFTRSNVRMGDGSYCAAQIWAFQNCGVIACSEVTGSNYVYPQTKSVRSNAGNGGDFLNDHVKFGLKHRMGPSTRIRDTDDLWEAITVLKQPCMICSNWGFGPSRDIGGPIGWVYKRQGSWSHNMTLSAAVKYKGNRYFKDLNQWGPNAHRNGWHFWIDDDTMNAWLKQAECQTIGDIDFMPLETDYLPAPY